jgi:hypothetical protein
MYVRTYFFMAKILKIMAKIYFYQESQRTSNLLHTRPGTSLMKHKDTKTQRFLRRLFNLPCLCYRLTASIPEVHNLYVIIINPVNNLVEPINHNTAVLNGGISQ